MFSTSSSPLTPGCTPTKHILSCMHILSSRLGVPCSETCTNPSSPPGAFAYHCAKCRYVSDKQLLACFGGLGTVLYAYDPRLPAPTDPLQIESLTLHDRALPSTILVQLCEPLAAHKFWFQYRMNETVSVAYVLLTRNSVRERLVQVGSGFAITADDDVKRIITDPKARSQAKRTISRIVRGIQTSQQACAWWQQQRTGDFDRPNPVPKVGQELEKEFEMSREDRKQLWDDVIRLTNTSPSAFWSENAALDDERDEYE